MLWDLDLGGSFLVKTAAFPTSEVYDHIKSNTELIVTSDVITHAKIHQVWTNTRVSVPPLIFTIIMLEREPVRVCERAREGIEAFCHAHFYVQLLIGNSY